MPFLSLASTELLLGVVVAELLVVRPTLVALRVDLGLGITSGILKVYQWS